MRSVVQMETPGIMASVSRKTAYCLSIGRGIKETVGGWAAQPVAAVRWPVTDTGAYDVASCPNPIRRREGGISPSGRTTLKVQDERHELRKHPAHPIPPLGPAMQAFPILTSGIQRRTPPYALHF